MKLTKQELQQQFDIEPLSQRQCEETLWKKLLSEYTSITEQKKLQLKKVQKQIEDDAVKTVSSTGFKFSRIFPQNDEDIINKQQILQDIKQQMELVKIRIQEEEDRGFQYQQNRTSLKKEYWDFKKQIQDMKIIFQFISKQEIDLQSKNINLKREFMYLQSELQSGEDRLNRETSTLNNQVGIKKNQQKEQRHQVYKAYQNYNQMQDELQQHQVMVQKLQEQITSIDFELELKRLAKIDSQKLLLEIEEIQIISCAFIAKDQKSIIEIEKELDLNYWVQIGRAQLPNNIQRLNGQNKIDRLYQQLNTKTQQLANEQFNLARFLQRLSNFFNFCDGNVKNLVELLIKIYQYELMYDVTLKNRLSDLQNQKQMYKLELRQYDEQIQNANNQNQNDKLYDNLLETIHSNIELKTSQNLVDEQVDPIFRQLLTKNQSLLWKLLIFLTNGLQRWIRLVKSLSGLLNLNGNIQIICQNFQMNDSELFDNQYQIELREQIWEIIDKELDSLYIFDDSKLKMIINNQKQSIYAQIKNDFVLYNWGSKNMINMMIKSNIHQFQKLQKNINSNQKDQYKEVVRNFITLFYDSFDDLQQEAYRQFQNIIIQLMNRFIELLQGIQYQISDKNQIQIKQNIIGRRDSAISQPDYLNHSDQNDNEMKSINKQEEQEQMSNRKGLFGQDLDFKKLITKTKCEQYQVQKKEDDKIHSQKDDFIKSDEQDLRQIYNQTINKIQDMQEINIRRRIEYENIMKEKQLRKMKHYMQKSSRSQQSEQEMGYLIKLGKQLFTTINQNETNRSPKNTQQIIQSLHKTYSNFYSNKSQFKKERIEKQQSKILPKLAIQQIQQNQNAKPQQNQEKIGNFTSRKQETRKKLTTDSLLIGNLLKKTNTSERNVFSNPSFDTQSSPSMKIDILSQELRNKIFGYKQELRIQTQRSND